MTDSENSKINNNIDDQKYATTRYDKMNIDKN